MQEAQCSGLDQCDGSSDVSHGALQDCGESSEVGSSRMGIERDGSLAVSNAVVGDVVSTAQEADGHSVLDDIIMEAEGTAAVIEPGETSGSKGEDIGGNYDRGENMGAPSSSQDFATVQERGVGSSRMEIEKDGSLAVSDAMVGDAVSTAQEADGSSVSDGVTMEAEGTAAVIEPGETSGSKGEDIGRNYDRGENMGVPSSSQDFATVQERGVGEGVHKQQHFPEDATVIVSTSTEELLEEQKASALGRQTISLAKVLEGLEEEEVRFLLKSRESASMAGVVGIGNRTLLEASFANSVENLKQQLFLTNVEKDCLHWQLAEQIEVQMESDQHDRQLLDEVSKLQALVKESKERNTSISEELMQCRSELQAMAAGKEELEIQFLSARGDIEEHKGRASELQDKLEQSQKEEAHLLVELANCKNLLGMLQTENARLTGNLISATEERKKLEAEQEYFASENKKLAAELSEHKERLVIMHDTQMQLEAGLEEAMLSLERLTEDNNYLSSSLDLHKEKVKEFDDRYQQLIAQAEEAGNKLESSVVLGVISDKAIEDSQLVIENFYGDDVSRAVQESEMLSHARGLLLPSIERKDFGDSVGLHALKGHMEEAKEVVQKLEKAIQGMHSQSASLRSGGKTSASGVSKLIQAFESKVQQDDTVSDDVPLTEGKHSADPFELAQEQTSSLRAVLERFDLDVEKANELFEQEQDSKRLATVALKELEVEHEAQRQRNNDIEGKSSELVEKLAKYESVIDDLLNQLNEIQRSADEMAGIILNNAESLRKEVADKTSVLEQEQMSLTGAISEAIEKLNLCIGLVVSPSSASSEKPDVGALTIKVVDASIKAIEGLHKKLEAAYLEQERILKQVESLQKEVADKTSILEQEQMSRMGTISEAIEKLNSCTGLVVSPSSANSEKPDVGAHATEAVNAAIKAIEGLHKKLEAAYLEHERIQNAHEELNRNFVDMQGRNEAAVGILNQIYSGLRQLANDSSGNVEASETNIKYEELLDLVPSNCKRLMEQLQKLLDERHELLCSKNELESELMKTTQAIGESNQRCVDLGSKVEELESELMKRTQAMQELNKRCVDLGNRVEEQKSNAHPEAIAQLVKDVVAIIHPEDMAIDSEMIPIRRLEASVALLLQKYREAVEQVSLSKDCLREFISTPECSAEDGMVPLHTFLKEEVGSKLMELNELKQKMLQLDSSNLHEDDEVCILKENLSKAEEALKVARSELHAKGTELEQSEQRLSSVREKLGIAVAKGKGLIVQRDSLKQLLAEKSSELEKCMQELESKDVILHEVESKLKAYSEAGERVEALETELSYIRNSATALRESFLIKDSILQRIEEILEDLELPEHFHSRDIIEKIEWLARSITGNSLPLTDWDQKNSVGGSYSDGGFVVMDAWKEDLQPSSNPGFDDLRRKYDELQSKFYGLAEHNEMLEQSLVERNNLVQRWEEVLDRIDMPLQLRSMEPEEKIEWLGRALSEGQLIRDAFQVKIENLEISSDSLIAELEESQKKLADLEAKLAAVTREKELLSESMEKLTCENHKMSEKAVQDESGKSNLLKEVADLQEKLAENLENYHCIESDIKRLQGLVNDALLDHDLADNVVGISNTEHLEGLLRKLIDNYMAFCLEKSMRKDTEMEHVTDEAGTAPAEQGLKDLLDTKEQELLLLKEELEVALGNLVLLKEEKDTTLQKYQSLISEREAICKERDDLQEQLKQEEQKSASAREKLNVAVRKGKGLVQQRDGLKQTIEEMHTELERLKNEFSQRENTLLQYGQKIQDLSAYAEKVEALQAENSILRNRLTETEHSLQDSGQTLSGLLTALHAIDVGGQVSSNDPVQKMEGIGKLSRDLHAAAVSSEHEAKKSKRAAELLLVELNEVQDRADSLQEDLEKAQAAATELSKQREKVETARIEAVSNLEQFITAREVERRRQHADFMELKAGVDQLLEECFGFANLLNNVFSKDLELLRNVEVGMVSFLKQMNSMNAVSRPLQNASGDAFSSIPVNEGKISGSGSFLDLNMQDGSAITEVVGIVGHGLRECMKKINDLKRKCHTYSTAFEKQAARLPEIMETIRREVSSQKESSESLKKDVTHLESLRTEKDAEINMVQKNIALLYEACSRSLLEIENRKAHMIGNGLTSGVHLSGNTGTTLLMRFDRKETVDGRTLSFTEESIRTMADALLSAVKGSANTQAELVESNERELKATVSHLQNELQEKDIQRNRICSELVTQIKEAEATAKSYIVDLESANTQVHNLEKQLESMKNEQRLLETRVNELRDYESTSKGLQEEIRSMNGALSAKDQEIESLMQALDEEESQMEDLSSRIEELEKVVQQKNLALENLEASRGKAMAKLSTTVSKFDELHHLSESLLSEVENLQTQLQGRDAEISFLRQEVTRCTNDVLSSQENSKRNSTDVQDLMTWLNMMVSRFGVYDVHLDDQKGNQIHAFTEVLEKHITSALSELDDLRLLAQSKDALLQAERSKFEELLHKGEILEISLHEKESQLALLQGAGGSGQPSNMNTSETLDVEPLINKRVGPVRSIRKANNDQVAIAIDTESGSSMLDDEDDDKVHGFKSLTMSRIVPRVTRPIADKIDGIWVSGERMLMRQPTLRLGVVIYWFMLHILLATSIF
ncbi:trans-Golgi network-localized SYP41-interacting protein 1-like isoform X2 [Magnolia sinica]|uniref:trans-Golgi network-localized SYP41-interacting protein 1-like isoform X2 n=1 Tax=Magnolia sinica TaxID=86752 RepID=UPI0026594BE8|nr:trans-Golgi network-localized SYP41-interacting protein 1-like isoform X2 [Magnolia sinica]